MFISRKQDQGIEAYVGQINDIDNNFNVKYFEIKNDTSMDLLKYSNDFLTKRSISFDLERQGIRYYFELDLDSLDVSFNFSEITQLAPENIDFYDIYIDDSLSVAPCTIPYDPEIIPIVQPRSTYSYIEIGETWYHKQVVSSWYSDNDDIYEYYALGGTEGNIVDVGKGGSANWTSALKFWGHVRKNGEIITTMNNYFNIKAGVNSDGYGRPVSAGDEIEFRIYTGSNTIFTSGRFNGTCKINGSDKPYNKANFDLVMGMASAVAGINPLSSAVAKVSSFALKIFQGATTSNYTLGSEFITSTSGINKYIICNKFDSSVSLDKNEHEVFFSGFVSTYNSNATPNASTDCVIEWHFNMCNGNRILKSETVKETIKYVSNMS